MQKQMPHAITLNWMIKLNKYQNCLILEWPNYASIQYGYDTRFVDNFSELFRLRFGRWVVFHAHSSNVNKYFSVFFSNLNVLVWFGWIDWQMLFNTCGLLCLNSCVHKSQLVPTIANKVPQWIFKFAGNDIGWTWFSSACASWLMYVGDFKHEPCASSFNAFGIFFALSIKSICFSFFDV